MPVVGIVSEAPATDVTADVCRLDAAIEAARKGTGAPLHDAARAVSASYTRARLVGDMRAVEDAWEAASRALVSFGAQPDLAWLVASISLELHRVDDARAAIASVPDAEGSNAFAALMSDIDAQQGRVEHAHEELRRLVVKAPSWANFARLAALSASLGDRSEADRFYAHAEDEITAKEMQAYAWIQLQRGRLELDQGHFERAAGYYGRAARSYTGFWLTEVHLAELARVTGEASRALALYEGLLERIDRPELERIAGDVCMELGAAERGERHHARALRGFLASVERGHRYHWGHLARYYGEVCGDRATAVEWARRDVDLRPNAGTKGTLAWALALPRPRSESI